MSYEELTNRDTTVGIHVIFQYLNDVTGGLFMPMVIALLYIVLVMSMYYAQKRTTGKGRLAVCFAVGGYVMAIFSFILGMIPGLLNGIVIVEVIIMASVGTLWLFFSKNDNF